MPTPIPAPPLLVLPFANAGAKNVIPVAPPITPGAASFQLGFPPETMIPIASGGTPPFGQDVNGVLYDVSAHSVWQNAGGQYQFSATLAAAIGGYPVGMVLQSNDGQASYVNILANNSTDFNTTPASIGVSWLPWAGNSGVSGKRYINANTNLVNGWWLVDSAYYAAPLVLTLPPLVASSRISLTFEDASNGWDLYPIRLARNGGLINGVAQDLYLDASNQQFTMWSDGPNNNWKVC